MILVYLIPRGKLLGAGIPTGMFYSAEQELEETLQDPALAKDIALARNRRPDGALTV